MGDLDDILAFLRVVETGSITRAAERLGVTKSVVSRRVARLERSLGTRLVARTTRGAGPTEAGAEFEERATRVLADLAEARDAVAGRDGEPAGRLRLAAPLSFGLSQLSPVLAAFAAEHPRLVLDVAYGDRPVDLAAEGFDAALRIATEPLPDSRLVARRLSPVRNAAVASPAYLARAGVPAHPGELARHDCLVVTHAPPAEQWRFRAGTPERPRWLSINPARVRLRADSGDALKDAAVAGLGIAALPTFITGAAIRDGLLVPVLEAYPMPARALYALRPPGPLAGKTRALIDHLAARFGPEPTWDPCFRAAGPQPAVAAR
jgi:DNA-binding transcriptional LysR family regulator